MGDTDGDVAHDIAPGKRIPVENTRHDGLSGEGRLPALQDAVVVKIVYDISFT